MRMKRKRRPSLDVLAETIIRLDEEWKRSNGGRNCPKCRAEILGKTLVYDIERHAQGILECIACAQIIHINGGRHLKKLQVVGGLEQLGLLEKMLKKRRRPHRSCSRRYSSSSRKLKRLKLLQKMLGKEGDLIAHVHGRGSLCL